MDFMVGKTSWDGYTAPDIQTGQLFVSHSKIPPPAAYLATLKNSIGIWSRESDLNRRPDDYKSQGSGFRLFLDVCESFT
jgi:hypothetical protein